FAGVQHRRAGKSPLQTRSVVRSATKFAEVFLPKTLPFHVEAKQPLRTEQGDDPCAVGGGCRVAMRGFGVPLHTRHGFESEFVPENPAGGLLQAEEAPLVRLLLGIGSAITVKTDFQFRLRDG